MRSVLPIQPVRRNITLSLESRNNHEFHYKNICKTLRYTRIDNMRPPSLEALSGFSFVLRVYTEAQITLAPIPTSACAGKGLSCSATFASSTSHATGAQRIPTGDFWNQVGAEWLFDTDTSGVLFSDLAANDGADTFVIHSKNVSLDDSKTKWTFSAASGVCEQLLDYH